MKLTRNLVFGMRGDDVRALRRDLVWLGFDIESPEITDGHFDKSTRDAVKLLQTQNHLKSEGVVGPKTAATIRALLESLPRAVQGSAVHPNGGPYKNGVVRLFDKDLRTETKLGEATTTDEGYFELHYTFGGNGKIAPNLLVKVFATPSDKLPVAISAVIFAADPQVIINLVVGDAEYRGPSDFELLMKDIKPLVEDQKLKVADLVDNDLSFLSNQTNHPSERIVHAILSNRLAQESQLPPAVIFAWLRQGLPTEASALLSQDPSILRSALVNAVKNNIIPPGFETEDKLKATFESLNAWRIRVVLQAPADEKRTTLGSLLKSILPKEPLRQQFMSAYAEHSGSVDDFWKKLEKDNQLGIHARELRFAVIVANLGENHPPLMRAIRSSPELKDLKDLARLNAASWLSLIEQHNVDPPAHIEGTNADEKAKRYARSLAEAVEEAAPTEFFVAQLNQTKVDGKEDLLNFFRANADFHIGDTRLETYLKTNPAALNDVKDKPAAMKRLKAVQRLYRIAPSYQPTVALLADNHSASTISRMGRNAFVSKYGQHFNDATQARETYAKAQQVRASATALVADVNLSMNGLSLNAVPAKTVVEIPELSTLFGSLDFCSCGDCQSVNSPAAYLVDVLNFLNDRKTKLPDTEPTPDPPAVPPSVKDLLFARRPDLGEIELTCENTNTPLPYVDLVLEVLEDAVAPFAEFTPFQLDSERIADLDKATMSTELETVLAGKVFGQPSIRVKRQGEWWIVDDESFSYTVRKQQNGELNVENRSRQTKEPQSERGANPQYTNRAAYEKLREAIFPWSLPFDYNHEQVKAYLSHLGVTRDQIVEAFKPGERSDVLQNSSLAHEFLGLTSTEASLITDADPPAPWTLWGFAEENLNDVSWLERIENLAEFLRRSGLEFTELLNLLETRYVNGSRSLTIESTDPDQIDTCEIDKLALRGLNAGIATRIVRFVRLWRKLKWYIFDLDRALLPNSDLADDSLQRFSHLARLRKRFNLPIQRLLPFWANLDTTRYTKHDTPGKPIVPSLYDQLFRSRSGINPLDPSFTEDPLQLSGSLVDHSQAIAAALGVGVADVQAMLGHTEIFTNSNLTLENLSLLYRHFTLARGLRLSVDDYQIALTLVDRTPFDTPTRTVLFVETITEIKDSGLSFAELDYLLRPHSAAVSGMVLEERVIVDRLQELGQELEKGAVKESIARKLAETFGFEMSVVSSLEPQWTSLMSSRLAEASKFLIASLLNTTPVDPGPEFTRANFNEQFEDLIRLHKISAVASHFNIGPELLEWLLNHGKDQGLFDLKNFPVVSTNVDFEQWIRLVNFLGLRAAFSRGEQGLLELIKLAHRSPGAEQAEILGKLVEQTNWNRTELEFLIGSSDFALTFPNGVEDERALLHLRDCFVLLKRLGISAVQAKNLSTPDVGPDAEFAAAQAIRQATRAKYDDAQWLKIAKPLRDVLREKQRAALVDYLISHSLELDQQDTNGLYAHFLIDVEMSPCMMTSRIKQAISSVQLFVQRCLMNLEDDIIASSEEDDAWDWWKWMKNYRVWEANRKVFLYPENWIEPELRDDKSPFFRELESELMESDLTLETAELAFLNYVEKLDQVARLGVMGVFHQKEGELDILHVFARTHASPRVYYYRQRVNSAYWTPWEKVDLDIEGNHLIPVVWNSRLFVFWPMFMEKTDPLKVEMPKSALGGPVNTEPKKYLEIRLAWSERKQGHWTTQKISSRFGKIRDDENELKASNVYFALRVADGNDLVIEQLLVKTKHNSNTATSLSRLNTTDPLSTDGGQVLNPLFEDVFDPNAGVPDSAEFPVIQNRFVFNGCYFDPQVIPSTNDEAPSGGLNALPGTKRSYMFFRELEENGLNLPVRIDLANSRPALARTPGPYWIASQGAESGVTRSPFLFLDRSRNYLITPRVSLLRDRFFDPGEVGIATSEHRDLSAPFATDPVHSSDTLLGVDSHRVPPLPVRRETKYYFQPFYHPYVCAFIYILNRQGLDQMLRREVQLEPRRFLPAGESITPFSFQTVYVPSPDLVAQPYPTEDLDFSASGSYSSYNWELFFHAPLLIADRLTKNQRFEEAAKWFHYIFNPTDTSSEPAPQRYWQTREFFEKTNEDYQQNRLSKLFDLLARANEIRDRSDLSPAEQKDLQSLIDLEASIKAWQANPFKPHLVARMRTTAYQKTVVMKYIDNLIAWGDQLFRRDTLETLNEATQLYVLAAQILGQRPVEIPPRFTPRIETYNSLESRLDDFSNALVEIEELVSVDAEPGTNVPEQQPPSMLYFCLPKNDKLLGYWDTVADRLFKLRHCMNIEGVVRQLPLFEPPIDPALLVRGVAAGLDLNSLLNDVTTTLLPNYRFNALSQKATELCGELKSLGATLLATLEKRDVEALSLLRAKHERSLVEMIEQVRDRQLDEAAEQLKALSASRDVILGRLGHYQRLLGDSDAKAPAIGERLQEKDRPKFSEIVNLAGVKMFKHEVLENVLLITAQALEAVSGAKKAVGAVLYSFPEINMMPMGSGTTKSGFGQVPSAAADGVSKLASAAQLGAHMTGRLGSYITRELDWVLQHNIAAREIMQIDKQILAAEIRTEIARLELRNHRKQMENAAEVEDFMRDKYTNKELYYWMVGQLSGVYFQAYQLAYETAKRTELCYRHELGLSTSNFIQFGYWDSLKKGLMAGEKLHHDLKRMEVAYLDANRREFELTKHVSLVSLDPEQFLTLKETGTCEFQIPEWLFDLDTPGHFMRRLKLVGLTSPCITGPYTSINFKLQLVKSEYRQKADLLSGNDPAERYQRNDTEAPDPRFVDSLNVVESIVTSTAQNDAGLFEPNMRDERYLPFEGTGAISTWRLELPMEFKSFDYSTISDVILHLRYTAQDGGSELSSAATTSAKKLLNEPPIDEATGKPKGLARVFSLRHEFPSEWHRFVTSPATSVNALTVDLAQARFPYFVQGSEIKINEAAVFERTGSSTKPKIGVVQGSTITALDLDPSGDIPSGLVQHTPPSSGKPGPWTFGTDSDPTVIQDVFVLFDYSAS